MWDAIQLKNMQTEQSRLVDIKMVNKITHSTIFEEKNCALEPPRKQNYKWRNKKITIKDHYFRDKQRESLAELKQLNRTNKKQKHLQNFWSNFNMNIKEIKVYDVNNEITP